MHGDSSAAVNLCSKIIVAPQFGQCQKDSSQPTGGISGAAGVQERYVSSCWQRDTREARLGGGLQVAMTEQNLDRAQVGAGLQQVRRPTVRPAGFRVPAVYLSLAFLVILAVLSVREINK